MGTAAVAWAAEMRGAAALEMVAEAEEARAAAAAAAAKAPVVTEMAEVAEAEMDLGRVVTWVAAASVAVSPVAAVAREEATEVVAALEASMVGLAVEAMAVEARGAAAAAVAVAGAEEVTAEEVKEAVD